MRRADRLFQIVQYLRGGRLQRADDLAARLEVSRRTIYRDIADLQSTGVPIDGEAGIGYIMREGYDLPPLMFTKDEMVALVAGARLLRAWGGASLAAAAQEALAKIADVLPPEDRARARTAPIYSMAPEMNDALRATLDTLETAIQERHVLQLSYVDGAAAVSLRQIRPLGLLFWGKVWTLAAYCELRADFRMFRIDRMKAFTTITGDETPPAPQTFKLERGKTLADFFSSVEQREGHVLTHKNTF